VSASAQLEEVVEQRHDAPVLLVEWSSPWREFVTAVRPALARSDARLAGEAPYGMFPYRGMIPCLLLEAFLIFAAIVVKVKLDQMRPYVAPRLSSRDVIYYSGDELPRTEDLGGAQAGTVGRAGGGEAHHRTQTIRIARGSSLAQSVVDAPNLKLPSSRDGSASVGRVALDPNHSHVPGSDRCPCTPSNTRLHPQRSAARHGDCANSVASARSLPRSAESQRDRHPSSPQRFQRSHPGCSSSGSGRDSTRAERLP
jgi:hypothetical protein